MKWRPVETAPMDGRAMLIHYKNSSGMGRTIKAMYAPKFFLECDEDYAEYDEDADQYYAPEGWYELIDNWDEFSSIKVHEGEPTHWMPLPESPTE